MIWKGIKNYLINLKHFFSPLGAFALGIVLGISVLIPGTIASLQHLVSSISQITGNVNFDFRAFLDCIAEAVGRLDWENPSEALDIALSADWLSDTFNDCIHSLLPEAEQYAEQITASVTLSIAEIISCAIVFLFMSSLGLLGGFLLTRFLVKRTIAKRAWWKNLLSALFDIIFSALTAMIFFWLGKLWTPSVFISGIALAFLYSAAALLKAYVLYGWKKIHIQKVVTLKNAGLLILTNFLVFLIATAFVSLAFVLTNTIAGIFICIPFIFIGFLVIIYNAEAFVKISVERQNEKLEK